jgi:hypothetical protein
MTVFPFFFLKEEAILLDIGPSSRQGTLEQGYCIVTIERSRRVEVWGVEEHPGRDNVCAVCWRRCNIVWRSVTEAVCAELSEAMAAVGELKVHQTSCWQQSMPKMGAG